MDKPRRPGLFAFRGEEFFHHFQDTPQFDHVAWFDSIGLPSHGPAYDAILRGKVTHDVDLDQDVVGFYGAPFLSNQRYGLVVETFGLDEDKLVEKRLHEPY